LWKPEGAGSAGWKLPCYTGWRQPKEEIVLLSALASFIVLVADIYAIVNVLQSRESTGAKVLWIALVILLPVIGVIAWYFAGPKSG
jgi:hypothetical protein